MGPLCPISIYGSPVTLLKFQMAPRLTLLRCPLAPRRRFTYIVWSNYSTWQLLSKGKIPKSPLLLPTSVLMCHNSLQQGILCHERGRERGEVLRTAAISHTVNMPNTDIKQFKHISMVTSPEPVTSFVSIC